MILKLAFVVVLAAMSCPANVYCDYHGTYAYYTRDEYPSGKHYRVYAHIVSGGGNHELRVKCD